jgi:hypothetical protein
MGTFDAKCCKHRLHLSCRQARPAYAGICRGLIHTSALLMDAPLRDVCCLQVQTIAEQAQGDLYNAISTLQFVCTGVKPSAAKAQAARKVSLEVLCTDACVATGQTSLRCSPATTLGGFYCVRLLTPDAH